MEAFHAQEKEMSSEVLHVQQEEGVSRKNFMYRGRRD